MAPNDSDRVKREIEELLDKLDTFVPEERLASKIKRRRREESGPGIFERTWTSLGARIKGLSVGHFMLAGLALTLLASFAPGLFGGYDRPVFYAGIIVGAGAFVLAFINRDSANTISGGRRIEKRWRGQPIDYSEPPANRLRNWWRARRRR